MGFVRVTLSDYEVAQQRYSPVNGGARSVIHESTRGRTTGHAHHEHLLVSTSTIRYFVSRHMIYRLLLRLSTAHPRATAYSAPARRVPRRPGDLTGLDSGAEARVFAVARVPVTDWNGAPPVDCSCCVAVRVVLLRTCPPVGRLDGEPSVPSTLPSGRPFAADTAINRMPRYRNASPLRRLLRGSTPERTRFYAATG